MSDATERWVPIVGYEGYYEVSDLGRVRSVDRMVNGGSGERFARGRVLSPGVTATGYHRVVLQKFHTQRNRPVHQLVLEAFVGPRPEGFSGCHNNGDPSDNRASNLRWDTASANMQDCILHGRNARVNATHCPYGHPYSGANIRPSKDGGRKCAACSRGRARRRRAERNAR